MEKFSDDELDSASESEEEWLVDEDDDEASGGDDERRSGSDDEDGEEDDDDGVRAVRRRRRMKASNPFESDDDDDDDDDFKPIRKRRRVSTKRQKDEEKTVRVETPRRASARVGARAKRKAADAARHVASLLRPTMDVDDESIVEDDASSSDSSELDFVVDDDEDETATEVDFTPRRTRLSLGSSVDEALSIDDVAALKRALSRLEETPRPGRVLISAAAHNAINVASEFLANGIRVDGQLNERGSKKPHITDIADALHIACERGNVDFVHAVRDQIGLAQFCRGGDTGGWPTSATGGTLVHSAADNEKASAECVAAAIMAESPPKGRVMPVAAVFDEDARGARTPLMIAAGAGPEWGSCVEALLRDARTYGQRAVRIAIRCQEPQEGCSAVHIAAVAGNVVCLEKFLKEDPSCLKVKDYNDSTPLHWASMEGRHETIRVLLEKGANRLAIDKMGWIPLLYANFHEKSEAVLYLLEKQVSEQLQTMFTAVASEDDGKSKLQVQKVLNLLAAKPAYYDAINNCIRRDMSLLGPVMNMLRECGAITIINLANRVSFLRNTWLNEYGLQNLALSKSFTLSAQDAWHDFFVNVWSVSPKILKIRQLSWGLRQPSGDVSGGPGPTREAFSLMANELCDGNRADRQLFTQDDARTYKRKEGIDRPSVLKELQCFGELLAHVVLFGSAVLPIPFSKVFLRRVIANEKCDAFTLDDLADVEPAVVKSIKVVLETDDVESLCLTFIDPTTNEETDVTKANLQAFKRQKIREMVSSIVDDASVHAIRTGLLQIMRKSQIEVLAPEEFGLVAAGSQSIDPKEWRRHASFSPSPEMEWFWDVVERMNNDDKSRLLQFSTGSSLLPVGSFAALCPPWSIEVGLHRDASKLPTAWTCFNTLQMPRYPSKELLEERLFCALRHGSAGFAFA